MNANLKHFLVGIKLKSECLYMIIKISTNIR